jgi:hypothetical protein
MDRMESRRHEKERLLVSMATDLEAARIKPAKGDSKRLLYQFRQLWDVANLMQERDIRGQAIGLSLIQSKERAFRYENMVRCPAAVDAKQLYQVLMEDGSTDMARFLEGVLSVPPRYLFKVQLPGQPKEPAKTPDDKGFDKMKRFPGGKDRKEKEKPAESTSGSRITVKQKGTTIHLALDLIFDKDEQRRALVGMGALAAAIRGEADLALQQSGRELLGKAALRMAEKGLSQRKPPVLPGHFPPAAFPREVPRDALWVTREPNQRISWMAGLLPHLGRQDLYDKIVFRASWKDPVNWMAARALVPEFIDPMYPESTNYTTRPDIPLELAVTHFVGISGVGLDAADYPLSDPRYKTTRGVFGYDGSASLDEVRAGRGLSSTILLVQIPHDGVAGVSPWIAGGGATVRGVPEHKSIEPFVLSTDRNGKPITHNGKRGTFAVMADGRVVWINANIDDNVFKALCTVNGPLEKDDLADLVPVEGQPVPPPKENKKAGPAKKDATPGQRQPPQAPHHAKARPVPNLVPRLGSRR